MNEFDIDEMSMSEKIKLLEELVDGKRSGHPGSIVGLIADILLEHLGAFPGE